MAENTCLCWATSIQDAKDQRGEMDSDGLIIVSEFAVPDCCSDDFITTDVPFKHEYEGDNIFIVYGVDMVELNARGWRTQI